MTEPFFDLFHAARRIGEAVAIEDALFELYGTAARFITRPQLSVALQVASRSHGELSEGFALRLPVSASIPTDQFRGISSPLGRAAMAAIALAERETEDPLVILSVIADEVLPCVQRVYNEAFALTSPHADGPFRVMLDRALEAVDSDFALVTEALNSLR